ncbi:hypothetical protein C0991_002034 [Blastosporella zonata]|nr:hypothetical protein C0991_002034 [Blastosporella zonata]
MPSATPRALVVGAGPSGLVCALSLIRNGVSVRIIEKNTQPRYGQRGAGIMPRSLELFNSFGCADEILKHAIPVPPARRYKLPKGTHPIGEFEMSPHVDPTPSCPYPNIVLLGQGRVEDILRSALAEQQCNVEVAIELVSFEQTESSVTVHLVRHGPDGSYSPEHASYDWMIGADGARGIVRKMSGFSFLGETRTVENHVVGDIYVDGLSQKYWHMWGDASTMLVSLRPTETPGLFNFIIAGHTINHAQVSSDEKALRKCLAENTGSKRGLKFKEITWVNHYVPNIRMVQDFQKGRILLVGDSAHVHSFTGGQGINTGIQDAYNLGWKLALVLRGLASPSLLHTYSEERIPVIREMLDRTTRILRRIFTERTNDAWSRGGGLLQLGINYRWSSIVLDERKDTEDAEFSDFDFGEEEEEEGGAGIDAYGGSSDGILCAGDRAPDASGLVNLAPLPHQSSPSWRLFDIFRPTHHTVLIFPPALYDAPAIIRTLEKLPSGMTRSVVLLGRGQGIPACCRGVDSVFEDREGHAHNAYVIVDDWAVVVVVAGPSGLICALAILKNGSQQTIRAALAKYSSNIERDVELVFLQQFHGEVEVKLLRSVPGEGAEIADTARYDWIIGADGAR